MIRASIGVGALAAIVAIAFWPEPAAACGGFMCNGGGAAGPTPVVQAGERVMFEQRPDGTIRAYVQIRYQQGAPVGFSWLVPVTGGVPELGVADPATFDQLDNASSPQFRFVNGTTGFGAGGGGAGCGATAADGGGDFRGVPGSEPDADDDGVRVWNESRVGDYTTAVIEGETGEAVRDWLRANEYDIPERASEIIDHYVYTGHRFAAFRYDPLEASDGTLPPITITYSGVKPCVPIKITAIASVPVLDIMVLAFADGRVRPDPEGEYIEITPDYQNIQTDFTTPTQTTYWDEVDAAVADAGGHGWVVEHASSTTMLEGLTDPEAIALATNNAYVTRFYTRMAPEFMDVDPEFIFTETYADVNRLQVIDLNPMTASTDTGSVGSGLRYAGAPFGVAGIALLVRRLRRRRR
ncbi:MAG: DUF2330 domain-containing protein [Deltaproteobacteria bacterium]|nr:DUF2330 domain-containing protein [Deltaproteobacteria bacterium]